MHCCSSPISCQTRSPNSFLTSPKLRIVAPYLSFESMESSSSLTKAALSRSTVSTLVAELADYPLSTFPFETTPFEDSAFLLLASRCPEIRPLSVLSLHSQQTPLSTPNSRPLLSSNLADVVLLSLLDGRPQLTTRSSFSSRQHLVLTPLPLLFSLA